MRIAEVLFCFNTVHQLVPTVWLKRFASAALPDEGFIGTERRQEKPFHLPAASLSREGLPAFPIVRQKSTSSEL